MYLVIKPFKIKNKLFSPGKMVKLSQEKASYLIKQGFIDKVKNKTTNKPNYICLLYTSPSPRDVEESRMPSSA